MRGFFNRVLVVDMTSRSFEIRTLPDDVMRRYLGGKGLGTYLLLNNNPAGVDPLGKDNRLIFSIGPVTGTGIWGSCRYGVFTKSPQTGFYSESYSGGTVAESMAGTGFDAFMIEGASDEPVWLEITGDGVVFHTAVDLWGLETYETEDRVMECIKRSSPGDTKSGALVIGPAGVLTVLIGCRSSYSQAHRGKKPNVGRTNWERMRSSPNPRDLINMTSRFDYCRSAQFSCIQHSAYCARFSV